MNTREGLKIGYARVSTEEQDYQGQVDALEKLGCTEIFAEKISGAYRVKKQLVNCNLLN